MIKRSAARIAAAVVLVGGLAIAPLIDISDSTEIPVVASQPGQAPQFRIQRRQEELILAGHTMSQRHERDLAEVASATFPDARIITHYEPLGIVPDYWADITVQTLYLLAETRTAEATISKTGLSVRGVIDDELGWQNRLDATRGAVPADFAIAVETLFVDGGVNAAKLCERAFSTFAPGSIEFEEASTDLRSSAYPRLDRVIALARTCAHSRILITGHTDASGNAALNQALSLRRATTVADYLANGGVDRARLAVRGAGATQPIADDSTRHGRSLNRRIEIGFELP